MEPKHFPINKIPQQFEMCQCQNLVLSCSGYLFSYDQSTSGDIPRSVSYGNSTLGHMIVFSQTNSNNQLIKQKDLRITIPYGEKVTLPKFTKGTYDYFIYERFNTYIINGKNEVKLEIIRKGDLTVRKCCR
jgi:hypothetical protein